jgi:carboxymethylenebutenolidase
MAENDDFFSPDAARQLEAKLQGMGKDVTLHVYPGTGHAFCNEENPLGTHDAEAKATAWGRTLEFLRSKLS